MNNLMTKGLEVILSATDAMNSLFLQDAKICFCLIEIKVMIIKLGELETKFVNSSTVLKPISVV